MLIRRSVSAVLLLATCVFAQAQDARDVADKVLPSVAMLVMKDANNEPIAIGSAFVVKPGILVTNAHVIREASSGTATFTGDKTEHVIAGIVAFDAHHDLALLKIADDKVKPLPLADASAIKVGDTVYAAGSPQGMAGTFSNGIISAVRKVEGGTILQTTAPISPGSSGGPLVNSSGQVIGVAVALIADGQNLNFAIAASHTQQLLRSAGAVKPLARQASQPSVLDKIGGPAVSGIEIDSFTWDEADSRRRFARGSFTVRNRYARPIALVTYQVLFYDPAGKLVESQEVQAPVVNYFDVFDTVPGNANTIVVARQPAAIRVPEGFKLEPVGRRALMIQPSAATRLTITTGDSVPFLNSPSSKEFPRQPEGQVKFRILDFEVVRPTPEPRPKWMEDPIVE